MSFWGFFFPSISPAWWRRFLAVFLWRRTARIARDTRQLLAQIISMTAELSTAALSSAFHSMEFPFRSTLVLDVAYPTCMASHRQQLRHADPIALVPVSRRPQVLGPPLPPPPPPLPPPFRCEMSLSLEYLPTRRRLHWYMEERS